jgi:DNA-binding MarR family transcriptional regulator
MKSITPATQLVMNLSLLQSKILKRVDSQLSIHGISFTEFMVMHRLNEAPGNTMRRIELAESISLSASGVTRLLLPMEKIGLVSKEANPRDARVSLVKLTDTGLQLFNDALASFQQVADEFMHDIDDREVKQFLGLTERLI